MSQQKSGAKSKRAGKSRGKIYQHRVAGKMGVRLLGSAMPSLHNFYVFRVLVFLILFLFYFVFCVLAFVALWAAFLG